MDSKMDSDFLKPSEQDVIFFAENGYWISPKVIEDESIYKVRDAMERMYDSKFETGVPPWSPYWKRGDDPGKLRKLDNAHLSDPVLYALATNPEIARMGAALMNTNTLRLFVTQLLYKPGTAGKPATSNVGWHQDRAYWELTEDDTIFTAWVALDDVYEENGCMKMVPRSNKWGLLNVSDFWDQDMENQEKQLKLPEGETFRTVPIVMKAGQVSFHHGLTLHGSGPNLTEAPRRSLAIHMMTGESRYRTGSPWDNHPYLRGLDGLANGDLIEHEEFPILYKGDT